MTSSTIINLLNKEQMEWLQNLGIWWPYTKDLWVIAFWFIDLLAVIHNLKSSKLLYVTKKKYVLFI